MAKTIEKREPPIRIAGSAEASVGSATTGRDTQIFSNFRRQAIKIFWNFFEPDANRPHATPAVPRKTEPSQSICQK